MSLIVKAQEAGGLELHAADEWVDGTLRDILEDDGQYGAQFKFVIHLDGDDDDRTTWAYCSQKLSPRSKLTAWVKGLDADALPEPGEYIDLKQFIGRRVQVMFEHFEGYDAFVDANVTKEKVVKIRKGKAPAKRAAAKPKAKVDDYGPDEAPF